MVTRISTLSSLFEKKAAAAGISYFDLSQDRERLEEAYLTLVGSERRDDLRLQ